MTKCYWDPNNPAELIETDVILNAEISNWTDDFLTAYNSGNTYLRYVITHELGHSFGLDHPWEGSSDGKKNTVIQYPPSDALTALHHMPFMIDIKALRNTYPTQALEIYDMGIQLFYTTPDPPGDNPEPGDIFWSEFPDTVMSGFSFPVDNIVIENLSTATNKPYVYVYLTDKRHTYENVEAYLLGLASLPAMDPDSYRRENMVVKVWEDVPPGEYYIYVYAGYEWDNNSFNQDMWSDVKIEVVDVPADQDKVAVNPDILDFGYLPVEGLSEEPEYFMITGNELSGPVEIASPEGFLISEGDGFEYTDEIVLLPDAQGGIFDQIFIKFAPHEARTYTETISISSAGSVTRFVHVAGSGFYIRSDTEGIDFYNTLINTSSSVAEYLLYGENIYNPVTISAPDHFQVSLSPESGFDSTVEVNQYGEEILVSIFVRFYPQQVGVLGGNIINTYVSGRSIEDTKTIAVSGMCYNNPNICVDPDTLDFGEIASGSVSDPQSYRITGSYLADSVLIESTQYYEISFEEDGSYSTQLEADHCGYGTINRDIWVRFRPQEEGFIAGEVQHLVTGGETRLVNVLGTGTGCGTLYGVELFAYPEDIGVVLSGDGQYPAGSTVNINASLSKGYKFSAWTGLQEDIDLLDNPLSPSTSFIMPDRDVMYTAEYNLSYQTTISVHGELDQPLPGMNIWVWPAGEPETILIDMDTDENGQIIFSLPAGNYRFDVYDYYQAYEYYPNGEFSVIEEDVIVPTVYLSLVEWAVLFDIRDSNGASIDSVSILFTESPGELPDPLVTVEGYAATTLVKGHYEFNIMHQCYDDISSSVDIAMLKLSERRRKSHSPRQDLSKTDYHLIYYMDNAELKTNFTVKYNDEPVMGAKISVAAIPDPIFTDANGQASKMLECGNYNFSVEAGNFIPYEGSFDIEGAEVFLNIDLDFEPRQILPAISLSNPSYRGIWIWEYDDLKSSDISSRETGWTNLLQGVTAEKIMAGDITGCNGLELVALLPEYGLWYYNIQNNTWITLIDIQNDCIDFTIARTDTEGPLDIITSIRDHGLYKWDHTMKNT